MELNNLTLDWLEIVLNLVVVVGVPLVGAAILAVGGAGLLRAVLVLLWQRYITPTTVERVVRAVMPDGTGEDLAVKAAMIAYKAVEQRVKAYGEMKNEERLALAVQYMTALYAYFKRGKLTASAQEALLEYEVYQQNESKAA